jgi:hypothetical protein
MCKNAIHKSIYKFSNDTVYGCSKTGPVFPHTGHLAMSRDIFVASGGEREEL